MYKQIHEINKKETGLDSLERVALFLLAHQGYYYTDEIDETDKKTLEILNKYNIKYSTSKSLNNRIVIKLL